MKKYGQARPPDRSNTTWSYHHSFSNRPRACGRVRSLPAIATISAIVRRPSIASNRRFSSTPIETIRVVVEMASVQEHGRGTRGQPFLDAEREREANRHVAQPLLTGDWAVPQSDVRVGAVNESRMVGHRSAPQLHRRGPFARGQREQPIRVRTRRPRAALRQVRRLQVPAAEHESVAFDKIEQLGNRVTTARADSAERRPARAGRGDPVRGQARLLQGDETGAPRAPRQVRRCPAPRNRCRAFGNIPGAWRCLLYHIARTPSGASRRVTGIGIGEMMQHAGADDEIEAAIQRLDILDRQLPQLEVRQVLLALQLLGVVEARGADVDADDARVGPGGGYGCCV